MCVAGGIGYSMIAPERFIATSTLVLDPVGAASASSDASLRTELDLLRSERVAQRVVENLRMSDSPAARTLLLESGDTRHTLPEFLALQLMERVRAYPAGEGGLVRVRFSAQDPDFAAQVANAYPQAYGEVSLEMRAAAIRSGVERAGQDLALLRVRLEQARVRQTTPSRAALDSIAVRAGEQFAHLARLALQSAHAGFGAPEESVQVSAALAGNPGVGADPVPPPSIAPAARAADGAGDAATPEHDLRLAQQNLERAEERLARLSIESIGAPFPAHLLVAASAPRASSKPPIVTCIAIGAAAGLLIGLLASLLVEAFDRRVRRIEHVARDLGIVVLGDLPAASMPSARPARDGRQTGLWLQRA